MLTQMDGAEGLDGVYVLAATRYVSVIFCGVNAYHLRSRPDLIDSALLRPGRLDKSLLCGMPDLEERKDVRRINFLYVTVLIFNCPQILRAVGRRVVLSSSVDLDEIAVATDGYSGADLQALLYNAHLEVIHDSIASTSDQGARVDKSNEGTPIEFKAIGGPPTSKVASKAEMSALEKRVIHSCALLVLILIFHPSYGKSSNPRGHRQAPQPQRSRLRRTQTRWYESIDNVVSGTY